MWQWLHDRLKGWRTILTGIVTFLTGIITYLMSLDWTQLITPSRAPLVIAALGILIVILRYFTSTPVGENQ